MYVYVSVETLLPHKRLELLGLGTASHVLAAPYAPRSLLKALKIADVRLTFAIEWKSATSPKTIPLAMLSQKHVFALV
jgi:hypothetical protein